MSRETGNVYTVNFERMNAKDEMEVEDKTMSIQPQGIENQIELIKNCAKSGTWVLISTLKFPSYWK